MKSLKSRISFSIAKKLAEKIDKQSFLDQLEPEWALHLPKDFDIEDAVETVRKQIKTSGSEGIFDIVGIKDKDIRNTLLRIKEERSEGK